MSGHGIIINLGNLLPFVFTFNPAEVEMSKKINYFDAPNIGGSSHTKFFTGFKNKEITIKLVCVDMEDPLGVTKEIAFFEALREPDVGWMNISAFLCGNENYPPPQVLFHFGTGSLIPQIWDVLDVGMNTSLFMSGNVRGVMGIPKKLDVNLQLSLDEDNVFNKANVIAKKAMAISGSVMSVLKEYRVKRYGKRKEQSGFYPGSRNSKW